MFDIFRPISWVIRSNGHTTNLRGFNQICSFQPQTWEEDHQNHCILGTLYFFFLVMGVSFVFCISGVLAICHFWRLDGAALLSFAAHASGALPFTDASQTQPPRTSRFGGFDVVAETNTATEALVKPLSGHPAFPPILISGPGRNLG